MRRLACLDGLRGVLATYVLLSHMAPFGALPLWLTRPFSHGEAAVDVFFILSGMVIARSLTRFDNQPAPFLLARAARLLPVFFVVFPIAVAIQPLGRGFDRMPWIGLDSTARTIWSEDWPAHWAPEIAAHLTMTHGLFPDVVLPNAWVSFLGAAWSLSTEWQFYALVAVLAYRNHSLRYGMLVLLAVAVAAIAWSSFASPEWEFSRAFLPNKAQYFALGLAAAELDRKPGPTTGRLYAAVLLAVLALCWAEGGPTKLAAPLVWTLALASERHGGPLAPVLRSRPLLWLGAISYPVYLVNEPAQKAVGTALSALFPGQPILFTALWVPLAIAVPMLIAWTLHVHVEIPGQRWGRRAVPRGAPA